MKTTRTQKTQKGTTILMTAALTTLLAASASAAGALLPKIEDTPVKLTRIGTETNLISTLSPSVSSLQVATGAMKGGGPECHRLSMYGTKGFTPTQSRVSVLVETLCGDISVQGKVLLVVDGQSVASGALYGDGRFMLSGLVSRPLSQIRTVEVHVFGQQMFALDGREVVRPLELHESWNLSLK